MACVEQEGKRKEKQSNPHLKLSGQFRTPFSDRRDGLGRQGTSHEPSRDRHWPSLEKYDLSLFSTTGKDLGGRCVDPAIFLRRADGERAELNITKGRSVPSSLKKAER